MDVDWRKTTDDVTITQEHGSTRIRLREMVGKMCRLLEDETPDNEIQLAQSGLDSLHEKKKK